MSQPESEATPATSPPTKKERRDRSRVPQTARGNARSHPKPASSRLAEVKARRQKFNEETRIFVLNGAQVRFSVELAVEIGDRESIMLLQYEFWLATEGIEVGDKRAVHDSYRTLHRFFRFWSYATTQRTFDALVEKGLLETTPSPGGKNDGRYVFMGFEKLRSLKSIVVAQGPPVAPDEDEDADPEQPDPEQPASPEVPEPAGGNSSEPPKVEVYQNETPVSASKPAYQIDTPACFGVYHLDTPASHPGTPVSHRDTPPSHSGTGEFQNDTPRAALYKERAGAVEREENLESGEELGSDARENGAGQPHATHSAPRALFYEKDVQVLLTVLGFNIERPDTLREKDWDALPGAVAFMRRERIDGDELRSFTQVAHSRWSYSPYLSQLETHFYQFMPARARAKSRQIEADNAAAAPGGDVPVASATPLKPATVNAKPTDDALVRDEPEKRRRLLRACANVFGRLPESEQEARREAAVHALGDFKRDRYARDLNGGREPTFGVVESWRKSLLDGVWSDHRAACDASLADMESDESTAISEEELGAIPRLTAFLQSDPSEVAAPSVSVDGGPQMDGFAGISGIASSLINQWSTPDEEEDECEPQ